MRGLRGCWVGGVLDRLLTLGLFLQQHLGMIRGLAAVVWLKLASQGQMRMYGRVSGPASVVGSQAPEDIDWDVAALAPSKRC